MDRAQLIEEWQLAAVEREFAWAAFVDTCDARMFQAFSAAAERVRQIKRLLGY